MLMHAQWRTETLLTVEDEDGFLALEPLWRTLQTARERPSYYESFPWAWRAWRSAYRPFGYRLHIIVALGGERGLVILPFVWRREGPFRVARWLTTVFYEHGDALLDPGPEAERSLATAWDAAARRFTFLRIPVLRADARLWPYATAMRSRRATGVETASIDCREWPDWNAYIASRSRNLVKDMKQSARHLEKAGAPRVAVIGDEEQAVAAAAWIHARKLEWLTGGGHALEGFAQRKPFLFDIVRQALREGKLLLNELTVDGTRIAAQLAFREGERLDCAMIAWDPAWRRCGPGRTLCLETIRWAFDNGIALVDLGPGTQDYKQRFASRTVASLDDLIASRQPAGCMVLAARYLWHRTQSAFRQPQPAA